MKKILHKSLKGTGIFFIGCFVLLVICSVIGICYLVFDKSTVLDNKQYDSIEELHNDYVRVTSTDGDPDRDHFPRELIGYVNFDNACIAICTYAHDENKEIDQEELYAYLIEENEGKFILRNPSLISASAIFPLNSNYQSNDYDSYYFQCYFTEEEYSIGIAYKDVTEARKLYFDGNEMCEKEMINPITGERFILCYGKSDKTYNYIQKLFTKPEERHTLGLG